MTRPRREPAPPPPRRPRARGGRRASRSSSTSRSPGARPRPRSGAAVQERVRAYLERMAEVTPRAVDVVVAEIGASARLMAPARLRPHPRDAAAPLRAVCHDCVWWQSRGNKTASKERWTERVEDEWGEWGTIYLDDDGRFLGLMQYGPSGLFPRAADLPAGPPSDDAVLVTCAYLARGRGRVGREVPPARRDRGEPRPGRGGDRGVRVPLSRTTRTRSSASTSTAPSSRATSSTTSGSRRSAAAAGSSSAGSSSAGSRRWRRAPARRCSASSRRPSRRPSPRRRPGRELSRTAGSTGVDPAAGIPRVRSAGRGGKPLKAPARRRRPTGACARRRTTPRDGVRSSHGRGLLRGSVAAPRRDRAGRQRAATAPSSTSAIWIALSAAPLRRLSQER